MREGPHGSGPAGVLGALQLQEAESEARFLGFKAGGTSGHLETKRLYQTRRLQGEASSTWNHKNSTNAPQEGKSALQQKVQNG